LSQGQAGIQVHFEPWLSMMENLSIT